MSDESERAGFLSAIRADPFDDTPRLVYADWLDTQPATRRPCPTCCGLKVGDLVEGADHWELHSGSSVYTHAVVCSIHPFMLVSESGDMLWSTTRTPRDVRPTGQVVAHFRTSAAYARRKESPRWTKDSDTCSRCGGDGTVYAPPEADRAEFIRLQCALADARRNCSCGACVAYRGGGQHTNGGCAAARGGGQPANLREAALWAENGNAWSVEFPSGGDLGADSRAVWRRGFLDEVSLKLSNFIDSAEWLFRNHPVTRVLATDRVPLPAVPNDPKKPGVSWRRGLGISGMHVSGLNWEIPAPLWDDGLGGPYWTQLKASLALSDRLVAWGRELAGLPNLRR